MLICSYFHHRHAQIGLFFLNLLQIVIVSRINVVFGVPDRTLVLFSSALVDGINQFKYAFLLFLVFYSKSFWLKIAKRLLNYSRIFTNLFKLLTELRIVAKLL